MVNVRSKRCSHGSCAKAPSFGVEGSKTAAYCKQHAEKGMVNVVIKRCSHPSFTRVAAWGLLEDGVMTVCAHHRSDSKDGLVINFMAACVIVGCNRLAKWGLDGLQPTRCPVHGPGEEGLVCILGSNGVKASVRAPPSNSRRGPPDRAKLEIV